MRRRFSPLPKEHIYDEKKVQSFNKKKEGKEGTKGY